jgi:hexosaminidase
MLVPKPTSLTGLPGGAVLTADTKLHAPQAPRAAALLRTVLAPATGLRLPDGPPGPSAVWLRLVGATPPGAGQRSPGVAAAGPAPLGAEGYRLRVSADGVQAEAHTETGLFWAVQTLRQLLPPAVYSNLPVRGMVWRLPGVQIEDVPRYAWRGSLLDVARWCHPVRFLYRYVDLLALHKLNTLHLHLTDDQGWRFEVRAFPRLAEVGGFRRESSAGHLREHRFDGRPHGGFYTQAELRDLVAYAAGRGVRVMPEIDLPGHVQAALAAYPELGNYPDRGLEVRTSWGISTAVLNAEESTLSFVRQVLDEVVDVFPGEYVHIGGDEVPPDEWRASPAAKARAAALGLPSADELLGWWVRAAGAHLARHGRRIGLWDEVLECGPPPGSTVFAWRGVDRVAAAHRAGHPVVAAPYTHCYFDWAEADSPEEPLAIMAPLALSTVYHFDPGPVLGTQGQVWSEYLPTPQLVEWRAFPRLAALAEVAWSGAERDFPEFRARLVGHLARLDELGVNYRPL